MILDFTGWKDGKSYFKGAEMPEDKVWSILLAKKREQIRAQHA